MFDPCTCLEGDKNKVTAKQSQRTETNTELRVSQPGRETRTLCDVTKGWFLELCLFERAKKTFLITEQLILNRERLLLQNIGKVNGPIAVEIL